MALIFPILCYIFIQNVIQSAGDKRLILSGDSSSTSTNGGVVCQQMFYCNIACTNGFKTGPNGCPVCQCTDAAQGSVSIFRPQYFGDNSYTHPCLPYQQYCPLHCQHGFVTGIDGCQYCICADPLNQHEKTTTPLPITTTIQVKVVMSNPCISGQTTCGTLCNNGYLLGPGNCQYCLCVPPGLVYTTAASTTVPSTTTELPIYLSNPCFTGQHICRSRCQYGYILGPGNCQYCMCSKMTTATTTDSTLTTTHLSQSNPNATSSTLNAGHTSGHMDNECAIALTICQLKCKNGFMADTNDCKFCVCKDDIYQSAGILKADEPVIHLMNPCVKGLDICNIFCYHGYLRGPKDCQYCACRQ